MAKATCSLEGCDRPRRGWGYCATHYRRFMKAGDPGPAEIRRWVPAPSECTVAGCDRPPVSRGLCSTHCARWRKKGDAGPAEIVRRVCGTCTMPGCGQPHSSRGYCDRHYKRLLVHGDAAYRSNGNFRGDDCGYIGVHHRLREKRGRASGYPCRHCGRRAKDWAYDHDDPAPRIHSDGRPYSLDMSHYIPLCASCHKRLDLRKRAA